MIIFQKVSKKFPDGTLALDQVSFQINPKEFVFFIGPSGAGKTTIMRLLRREILPSQGSVIFQDKNVSELERKEIPPLRRKIGMCFQDFKLLYDRTVFENVAIALEIQDLSKDKVKTRVEEALKNVDLEKKHKLFPIQLSGGELQRVGIARAIVMEPDVLIADEPTGNLDPKSGGEILKLVKEINLAGTTVLVATHNVEIVNQFNERVIQLDKGRIVSDEKKGKYKLKKDNK
jgi:cell division transport system ATP-binding protein